MASSELPPSEEHREQSLSATEESGRTVTLILAVLVGWVYLYNLVIVGHGPIEAFFEVVDTISEDVITGSLVTVVVGLAIVVVFTATKLYTQIISSAESFRILEVLMVDHVPRGEWRQLTMRLVNFQEEPVPDRVVPRHVGGVLIGLSLVYAMSWTYLILFSEALFFVSWSAGVNLPITAENLELLPTLALAIPFSARIMAYLRYPYTQDYADFMPGALFVLLLVASLGYLFRSDDQVFFLLQVWENPDYLVIFLRNGLVLAFLPVFSEGVFWVAHLVGMLGEGSE